MAAEDSPQTPQTGQVPQREVAPGAPPPAPESITAPAERLTEGAIDTHIHILAAPEEFALDTPRAEDPAAGWSHERYLDAYRALMDRLGIARTVLIQSTLYGADNAVTLSALKALGADRARGIGLVRRDVGEAALDTLADAGIKGVRLNTVHRGLLAFPDAVALAPRLAARGMHIQMLMHAHRHLAQIAEEVRALPVPVVFDHIGWPDVAAGPDEPGFQTLRALLADGDAYVKLSGLYRVAEAPFVDTDPLVAALVEANPERCLWGTDWPHIMLNGVATPDPGVLVDAFHRVVTDEGVRRRILVETPAALYGFS